MDFHQEQFTVRIDLPSRQLDSQLYSRLEQAVNKRCNGNILPEIGYIKPGSVKILSKDLGRLHASHLAGTMSWNILVQAEVLRPVTGAEMDAIVVRKMEEGVLAKNYRYPFTLFVPNLPELDNSDQLSGIGVNSYIRVRILRERLKPPTKERRMPEYWIICQLTDSNLSPMRSLDIPHIEETPEFNLQLAPKAQLDEDRYRLTNGLYQSLNTTKGRIDRVRETYFAYIAAHPDSQDLVAKALRQEAVNNRTYPLWIVAKLLATELPAGTPGAPGTSRGPFIRVQVLAKNPALAMAVNSEQTLQLGEHTRATLWEINTIYQLQLDATGRKAEFSAQYDLWFLHVKVLINPNELISPPHTYLAQLRTANQELQRHNKKALIDPAYLATAGKDKGDTINRAYYKMQEFLTLFGPAMISPGPMHVCFLCESPGGFIQAFLDYRKPLASAPAPADQLVAISKRASGMPGSTWGKLQPKLARNYSWVRTTTTASSGSSTGSTNLLLLGDADTAAGDILVAASRNRVYEEFASAPAQLITADGGFDADSDTEEMDTAQLILAEIVMALQLGAEGSHFIIKIFDMTTQFTIDLVHVLAYAYNRLQVIKPASSRLASSEKYLVCSGLNAERGRQLAAQLEPVLAQPAPVSSAYYQSILAAGSCSPLISQAVQQYNNLFIERQNSFILSGTDYADRYLSMAEKGQHLEIIEAMRPWIKLPTETST